MKLAMTYYKLLYTLYKVILYYILYMVQSKNSIITTKIYINFLLMHDI